jgi:hypothetical protein
MKSREKRMRKLRSAMLSVPRPKLHRTTSRINGQVRITAMLGKGVVLASLSLQQGLSEVGRSYPASLTVCTAVKPARARDRTWTQLGVHNTLTNTKKSAFLNS